MQDRLNQAILQARRQQKHVALLFLDLDRFKLVNDTLGHETGDYVLRDIAKKLNNVVREGDTVSREGGDEFLIILPDLDKPEFAQLVAAKILDELARPIEVSGHELTVTASIGISHYQRRDGRTATAEACRLGHVSSQGCWPQHSSLLHQ